LENIINQMAKQSLVNPIYPNNLFNSNNKTYKTDNKSECGVIGICYVPIQKWGPIYDEDTAYSVGTLFPGLNLPFLGGGK